jgi:hypothetical protein
MPNISGSFHGVREAQNAIGKMTAKADLAVKVAISRMAAEAEREVKNQIQPKHNDGRIRSDGRTTDAVIGGPPMTRSGDLRASIQSEVAREGFGSYIAAVGPTIVYGRAVELGAPNWGSDVKYPFVGPAYKKLSETGKLREIYMSVMKAAL